MLESSFSVVFNCCMIEVNIWLSTTKLFGKKLSNHGILAGFFASGEENVGHVNFQLEINETAEYYSAVEKNPHDLIMSKTFGILPESTERGYAQKPVRTISYTHSFWPKTTPTDRDFLQDCMSLCHFRKPTTGVESKLATHQSDMKRENSPHSIKVIRHHQVKKDFALLEIEALKEHLLSLSVQETVLTAELANYPTFQNRVEQLTTEMATLLEKKQIISSSFENNCNTLQQEIAAVKEHIKSNLSTFNFLEKKLNYFEKLTHPDEKTKTDRKSVEIKQRAVSDTLQQLAHQVSLLEDNLTLLKSNYDQEMKACQDKLDITAKGITYYENSLKQCLNKLNGKNQDDLKQLQADIKQKKELLERMENSFKTFRITKGKHPNHSIELPTSDSGLPFHINERAVLEAMEKEKSKRYSLVNNNCASSAKRCILAGINATLREHLKRECGLSDKFFKIKKVETSNSLGEWAIRLQAGLTDLNFPKPKPKLKASSL
ncbi:hypothetical protein [Legionella clemsonensis]|uniref:Uncharacterized protein n=1 Tax=Legionella clemsonensis TaxID=1867846 RepID=A0A222P117_9GAMM|nr:hypothetical protein [Legionella clemsonensis]ASQ45552.1 hypothetical protein clem_04975 [Legionella clemsonensis]